MAALSDDKIAEAQQELTALSAPRDRFDHVPSEDVLEDIHLESDTAAPVEVYDESECYDGRSDTEQDDEFDAGPELLWILRAPSGSFRAGKSYRPDPTGSRTAVKLQTTSSVQHSFAQCTVSIISISSLSFSKSYQWIPMLSLYAA
jgi:hypothetical protein